MHANSACQIVRVCESMGVTRGATVAPAVTGHRLIQNQGNLSALRRERHRPWDKLF